MDGKKRPAGRDGRLPLITIIQLLFVCYYGNLRSWQREQLWAVRHTHSAAAYVYVRTSTCGQPDVVLSRSKKSKPSLDIFVLLCSHTMWPNCHHISRHSWRPGGENMVITNMISEWRQPQYWHKEQVWVWDAAGWYTVTDPSPASFLHLTPVKPGVLSSCCVQVRQVTLSMCWAVY